MYVRQQDWLGRATHCSELWSRKKNFGNLQMFYFFFSQIFTHLVNRIANPCLLLSNLRIKKEDINSSGWLVISCQLSAPDNEYLYSETDFTQDKGNFLDDHLQEASPSGWSFARGWSLQMIICNHKKAWNAFLRP